MRKEEKTGKKVNENGCRKERRKKRGVGKAVKQKEWNILNADFFILIFREITYNLQRFPAFYKT